MPGMVVALFWKTSLFADCCGAGGAGLTHDLTELLQMGVVVREAKEKAPDGVDGAKPGKSALIGVRTVRKK